MRAPSAKHFVESGNLTEYRLGRVLAGNTHGLILGPYRVLDRLGEGGMGVVVLGEHFLLHRRVAIKVVSVDDKFPPDVLDRFYAEMRVLAELRHPHIVMAYDAGRIPAAAPDRPALHYLVMELIPGGDLEKQVCRNGPATTARACEWIRQAASGLQEAHDHHLIHRDLKPSNLLLSANDQVKVVDFGLARQVYSHKTDPRALLGSLEFMAPEQSTDPSGVGPPADIYGLGATLFWLLTGETPFPREDNVAKALEALKHGRPRRLRQFLPDTPPELDDLVYHMLNRDPAKRPPSPVAIMPILALHDADRRICGNRSDHGCPRSRGGFSRRFCSEQGCVRRGHGPAASRPDLEGVDRRGTSGSSKTGPSDARIRRLPMRQGPHGYGDPDDATGRAIRSHAAPCWDSEARRRGRLPNATGIAAAAACESDRTRGRARFRCICRGDAERGGRLPRPPTRPHQLGRQGSTRFAPQGRTGQG